jgi:hypothetical protein
VNQPAITNWAALGVLILCNVTFAQDQSSTQIKLTDRIPYGQAPVDYFSKEVDDAVAALNVGIRNKKITLQYEPTHGFLKQVLKLLDVPVESQLLVYSKTARSPKLVTPKTPRAIYFSDEVSVAWIPDAKELELTALDNAKGTNFYTLSQVESEKSDSATLMFTRRDRCLACHAGRSSLDVPGLLVRGFQTDNIGKPLFGFSQVSHEKQIADRFGGWFVTGSPKSVIHRGNLIGIADNDRFKSEPGFRASVKKLDQLTSIEKYAAPTSDWVAHLVFTHQMHGLNLMIRANLEERLGRHSDVEEQLVRYLVFADEAPLDAERKTTDRLPNGFDWKSSPYAKWFQAQGVKGNAGRSLRDFELATRVFRYRLSYLIELEFFDQMEATCRNRIYRRLWTGLTSSDTKVAFTHLEKAEKQAIIEIVAQTKINLPDYWK